MKVPIEIMLLRTARGKGFYSPETQNTAEVPIEIKLLRTAQHTRAQHNAAQHVHERFGAEQGVR